MSESGSSRSAGELATGKSAPVRDDIARKTYRYLRVSVVGLALVLGVSILIEAFRPDGERFGSISGYYYSPVRSIFVGALVAIGPALVSIKGRAGWEDTLLDLAGMLTPVVALVPTPLPSSVSGVRCPGDAARCIPPEFVPSVENNIYALAILGAAGLVFAWFSAGRTGRRDPATRWGLVAAGVTWVVFAGVFLADPDLFMSVAHYGAAIPFFVFVAAVAFLNGRRAPARRNVTVMTPSAYGRAYRFIGGLMVAVIAMAVCYYAVTALAGTTTWGHTFLVVEATLLGLFGAFWVLQTAENWWEEAASEEAGAEADARAAADVARRG